MTDDISKVVREMRERASNWKHGARPAVTAELALGWADRLEAATTPVEVDGLTPYARGVAAINSLDDFARMDAGVDPAGPRAAAFSALDDLARQLAEAKNYATRLAMSIYRNDYAKDAPNWEPLSDLWGVLSQIDNMASGLCRIDRAEQAESQLAEATRRLGEVEGLVETWSISAQGAHTIMDADDAFIRCANQLRATITKEPTK